MLKTTASFVLGSEAYPRGYASGASFPAAALDGHFEHPAGLTLAEINTRLSTQFEGVKRDAKNHPMLVVR
jgi:hypothetical protein